MDQTRALTILSALANGVHPATGEQLATDAPYQSPEVVRALFVAVQALENNGRRSRRRDDLPPNAGKPWSPEEDERLLAGFDSGKAPRQLAEFHGRTLAGIEARLEKLGRLSPEERTTQRHYGGVDVRGREPEYGRQRGKAMRP